MLVIDDNMFRLAKMQETLLKVSTSNRKENLEKYKKTVAEIDTKAFADILEEIKHIDEHNQSLESELPFLERIKAAYDQLLELQLSFKRICEMYGDAELKLSDLSRLNIDYIESRINAINGYLVNLENIEANKANLQKLSEQLVAEEKTKVSLDDKLLDMETALRKNFIDAEGRCIVDGQLQYASVVSEYKSLGFDFRELLNDRDSLEIKLSELEEKRVEVAESVRAAEICYNNVLSAESKQVLSDISKEFLMVKYKLTMLKILELLSHDYVNYDEFVKKREQLIDLIKYRSACIEQLGMRFSIDPFSRTKVKEQYETVLSLTDNFKAINRIRKEIGELNSRTEEMLSQNNNYLISLSDTRALIESNIGLSDIDITAVELSLAEPEVKKEIAENQVVGVGNIPDTLNMSIIDQKTASVIKRVNQMITGSLHKKEEVSEVSVPELVIVPKTLDEPIPKKIPEITLPEFSVPEVFVTAKDVQKDTEDYEDDLEDEIDEVESDVQELPPVEETITPFMDTTDIFETVTPFDEPSLFVDRLDDILPEVPAMPDNLGETIGVTEDNVFEFPVSDPAEAMPDAFWVTQDVDDSQEEDDELSFDEQIDVLLSSETKSDGKVKKRVA